MISGAEPLRGVLGFRRAGERAEDAGRGVLGHDDDSNRIGKSHYCLIPDRHGPAGACCRGKPEQARFIGGEFFRLSCCHLIFGVLSR